MEINKVLLLICCSISFIHCQKSIPKSLRECYQSNATLNAHLPFNLQVLVDIIRKAEKDSYTVMDIKTMSSSVFHRFKFDGIEYHDDIQPTDGIIPFSGTGFQRIKHRLIEEMVPGNADIFPAGILSQEERCVLHWAISNTIIKHSSRSTDRACHQINRTEKLKGRTVLTGTWDCPGEHGVILSPYGTVALGVIMGAVAASLQPQTVALTELLKDTDTSFDEETSTSISDLGYNEEEVDFVVPKNQMIHGRSMWHRSIMLSAAKINNVWLSTLAGELAEMVIYQGPLVGSDMSLGATGFWNNTMRPSTYYLAGSHERFEATRAELIAGIDGLILASYLHGWAQSFYSLRLSQILDMYYSEHGIAFSPDIRACQRAQNFIHAVPKTLLTEQTYAIAQALAYRKSIAHLTPEALERIVGYAVDTFFDYAKNHLFSELPCHQQIHKLRVEALIVFDGAWSVEYTTDFLAVLIQDLDVSMYGSKIGIIHGTSGEWLLNVTNSPSLAFQTMHQFDKIKWPTQFNYAKTLETIYTYLNQSWENNWKQNKIGNAGQVVVLLIPLAHMSENEKLSTLKLLQQIKDDHPDVHFVYYTSRYNANLFNSFVLSDEDYLIKNTNIDAITQYLATVPRTLRPIILADQNITENSKFEIEDYISPSESIIYRLHPHWRRNTKKILITMHTFGYGRMKVCSWNQFRLNGQRESMSCTDLSGHKDVSLTDRFKCTNNAPCPDTYYRIQNVTTLYKCAEIDCKTPDQVRYIIRAKHVFYKNSGHSFNRFTPFIYLFLVLQICMRTIR